MAGGTVSDFLASLAARLPIERFRDPPPQVGVLRLEGVIGTSRLRRGGITLAGYERVIAKLFAARNLKAVAILVNSPGGSPVQSSLVARRIRDLAEENEVPVIAFCEDMAASGGYWLACAGDEIFADPSSLVGSVGVIYSGFGFSDLLERYGIERRLHTIGERKGMLDPFSDERPEDVERLRELHENVFDSFREYVRERRKGRLKAPEDELFTGDIWTGRQALEIGLVDGLGEMRSEMRRRFGERVRFHRVGVRPGFLARLRGGLRIGIDPRELLDTLEEWASWQRFRL